MYSLTLYAGSEVTPEDDSLYPLFPGLCRHPAPTAVPGRTGGKAVTEARHQRVLHTPPPIMTRQAFQRGTLSESSRSQEGEEKTLPRLILKSKQEKDYRYKTRQLKKTKCQLRVLKRQLAFRAHSKGNAKESREK